MTDRSGWRRGMGVALGVVLGMALCAPAAEPEKVEPLTDNFMGFKLLQTFDAAKLKLPADLCHEAPTGIGSSTGTVVNIMMKNGDSFQYEGAGDALPFPLRTNKGVKYRTRATITLFPDRRIYQIMIIIRVPSDKHSCAAIEKSLMAAYGRFFSEKKGPYGTYREYIFQDEDKELKVGYADGGVDLSVDLRCIKVR